MIMVVLVSAFLVAMHFPPNYPDRAAFLHALAALPDRAPMALVLKALGKPDRIEHLEGWDGVDKLGTQTWFYGTDGPKGAATLAQFQVYNGQLAYHPTSLEPPPTTVISEVDLRRGMHIVLDAIPDESREMKNAVRSAWVVKTVNTLLPFGEAKCKAIVGECGRVMEGHAQLDPDPFFLCYSLFDPPRSPGYFDDDGLVWIAPLPGSHLDHPRWPVEIIDNVLDIRGRPLGGFGGYAPSFVSQFKRMRDRIHLRKSPLSAPK